MSAVQKSQTKRLKALRKRRDETRRVRELQKQALEGGLTRGGRTPSQLFVPTLAASPAPGAWRKRKFVLGVFLIPVCLLASITFLELFFDATVAGGFWRSEGFWFFSFGCIFWLSLGWVNLQPAIAYVFAHEMTHAITARLSGGKVHDMHVDEAGGYIETDATNTLVTLSPYMVPLYTLVIFALYGLLSVFVDVQREFPMPFLGWAFQFKPAWVFYWLVGMTWFFHVTFTFQVLRTEQSDLLHNGEFFSIMVIFLVNLAILGALFISASPDVSWRDVWEDALGMVRSIWHFGSQVAAGEKGG